MIPTEAQYLALERFVGGSPSGLLQLLVAAARPSVFARIIACPTYPVPRKTSGLSTAVQQLQEMMSGDIHLPTLFARLYSSVRTLSYRKRAGQFFTAADVAQWALSVAPLHADDVVCDAGAGTGVFADAIIHAPFHIRSYIAVENDPILSLCAAHVLEQSRAPESFGVWYANFLLLDERSFVERELVPPNVIISNPPFVRSRNLAGRDRMRATLLSSLGISLSALSGSGGYFLLRAAELVTPNMRLAPAQRLLFFFPKEAAGAAHARRLRADLQRKHGWTWSERRIPTSEPGVGRHRSNALALFFVFERANVREYVSDSKAVPDVSIGDLIAIRRGISTGCNDFFILTDSEAKQRGIPREFLSRILPTRISLNDWSFSEARWQQLRATGHRCWLLTLPDGEIEEFVPAIQEYLREGLRRGLHATPTAQRLRTWFSIPIPAAPADVFITYLFRGSPRFVWNSAQVYHLTNILGGRFVRLKVSVDRQRAIVEKLNAQAHCWIADDLAGREYRDGLRKIEPRELSMLPIPRSVAEFLGQSVDNDSRATLPLFE